MVIKRYHCLNCGHNFKKEVFEKGEAEAKRVRTMPVQCPRCERTDLRPEN